MYYDRINNALQWLRQRPFVVFAVLHAILLLAIFAVFDYNVGGNGLEHYIAQRIIIYGEKGTIIYNPESQPSLQVERYERLKWTVASKLPREHREFHIDEANNLRHAIEYFAQALQGKAEGNIDRAVAITEILETLEKK